MGECIRVATTDELSEEEVKLVEVRGRRIALFRIGDGYAAIEDACPHRGGPLSEGEVEENEVICPWHGARFDVRSGKALSPPTPSDVASYPVRVEGDHIEIEIADTD